MVEVEHFEQWRGQQVLDPAGEPLGKVDEIYFDAASGAPVLISIKSGLFGRSSKLVPVDGATVGVDYVRVSHTRESIGGGPDSAGAQAPDQDQLSALGATYGLRFSDGLKLQSAEEIEAHRAEAEAARRRAAELDAAAQEKLAHRDAVSQRAEGAAAEAEQARAEAEQARRAAQDAREQAEKYERD